MPHTRAWRKLQQWNKTFLQHTSIFFFVKKILSCININDNHLQRIVQQTRMDEGDGDYALD